MLNRNNIYTGLFTSRGQPTHPCIKRMDKVAACEDVVAYFEQAATKSMP